MEDWKGTKGEWIAKGNAMARYVEVGNKTIVDVYYDELKDEEDCANVDLICDAGNTVQKCGLLPSELLEQRDELIEFVNFINKNWDDFLKNTNLAKSYHTGDNFKFMNELPFKCKGLLTKIKG